MANTTTTAPAPGLPHARPAPCWVITHPGQDTDPEEASHYTTNTDAEAAAEDGDLVSQLAYRCVELYCACGCGADPADGDYHYPSVMEAVYDAVCGHWQAAHGFMAAPDCVPPAPPPNPFATTYTAANGDRLGRLLLEARDLARDMRDELLGEDRPVPDVLHTLAEGTEELGAVVEANTRRRETEWRAA